MAHHPRIYLQPPLTAGAVIALERDDSHHLLTVLRRRPGDSVLLFNGRDGEWRAEIAVDGKRRAALTIAEKVREQCDAPDLRLCFAPVKKARTDFIVEKATELGVARLTPVMTQFTQSARVRPDRLAVLAREAAEQTERLDAPVIDDAIGLDAMLDAWEADRPLLFCDEAGDAPELADVARASAASRLGVLIGPEGGFSDQERARLRACPFVKPVALGPRILRADTAAAAALAVVQSQWGDWRA